MKFDIKEVLVAGDRAIVRGEVTGTPAGELFGVPHSGKSFRIMAIDIQTIRDGKIARTYHLENWLSALGSCAQSSREQTRGHAHHPDRQSPHILVAHDAVQLPGAHVMTPTSLRRPTQRSVSRARSHVLVASVRTDHALRI